MIFFFCYSVVVESYHLTALNTDILFPYAYLQVIIKLVTQTAICLRVQVFEQESLKKHYVELNCSIRVFFLALYIYTFIFNKLAGKADCLN